MAKKQKNTKTTTGQYDKIFKENAEEIYASLIKHFVKVNTSTATNLPLTDLQQTIERKADFLKKITPTGNTPAYALHIEIQSENDDEMAKRMLLYDALIGRKYDLQTEQFVIYIGYQPLTMQNTLQRKNYAFSYHIIDIRRYDYETFLQAQTPEEVVLAILGDFKGEKPESIIEKILLRLRALSPTQLALGKYATQLSVISKLRKLTKETLNQVFSMPITIDYDVTDLPAYVKGEAKGKAEGKDEVITKMLLKGFSPEQIANILEIPVTYVLNIQNNLPKK